MILEEYGANRSFEMIRILGDFERKKHQIIEDNDFSYTMNKNPEIERYRIPGHFYISDEILAQKRFVDLKNLAKMDCSLEQLRKRHMSWSFCKDMCLFDVDEILKINPEYTVIDITKELIRKNRYGYPPLQIEIFLYTWFNQFPKGYYTLKKLGDGFTGRTIYRVDPRISSSAE